MYRDEAYIGVMIDDLLKGVSEPYRMFTSRSLKLEPLSQSRPDSGLGLSYLRKPELELVALA